MGGSIKRGHSATDRVIISGVGIFRDLSLVKLGTKIQVRAVQTLVPLLQFTPPRNSTFQGGINEKSTKNYGIGVHVSAFFNSSGRVLWPRWGNGKTDARVAGANADREICRIAFSGTTGDQSI